MEVIIKDIVKRKENFRQERLEQLSQAKLNAPSLIINSAKKQTLRLQKLFNSRLVKINPILDENGVVLPIDFSVEDTNNDTFTGYKLDLNFIALNIGIGQLFNLVQMLVTFESVGILEKTASDDFKIITSFYKLYKIQFSLLSGATVTVDMEDLEYDFQNKVNPTLNVDDTGAIPVVNEWAYKRDSILYPHLDRNSLGRGLNRFTFDGNNGVWLWRSVGESRSCSFEIDNLYTPIAGYLPLNGYEFINGEKSLDYPNSYEFGIVYYKVNEEKIYTINMQNAGIASKNNFLSSSEKGQVYSGSIEKFKSTFEVMPSASNWHIPYWMIEHQQGVFNPVFIWNGHQGTWAHGYYIGLLGHPPLDMQKISFDASRVVTTGKQTLTRRFGIPLQWKL